MLAFWSADPLLQRWRQSVAIQLPEGWEAYNTDVTPAEQVGKTTVDAPRRVCGCSSAMLAFTPLTVFS